MTTEEALSRMGNIEHTSDLARRIEGLASSLECGDGGVRGDFRAALAQVDALAEQHRGAVERINDALALMEERRSASGQVQMGAARAAQVFELLRAAGGQ